MKWITREKVKVDRVACPWPIRKFVDPQAEFIFVPANQVEAKTRELGFSALGLSDHKILENEFVVYDALYAECKRRAISAPKA